MKVIIIAKSRVETLSLKFLTTVTILATVDIEAPIPARSTSRQLRIYHMKEKSVVMMNANPA